MTLARMIRLNKLPSTPQLLEKGLREMEERDVEQVSSLFTRYMTRFGMAPEMTLGEVKHQFLSGRGDLSKNLESRWKGRRDGQVVWTFVVEVSVGCCLVDDHLTHLPRRTLTRTRLPTSFRSTPFHQQSSTTRNTLFLNRHIYITTLPTLLSKREQKTQDY